MFEELQKKSREALEWPKVREKLAELAASPLGRERSLALPLSDDEEEIRAGLQAVTECRALLEEEGDLPLDGLQDLRGVLERAAKEATLETRELLAVSASLQAGERLKSFFLRRRETAPSLHRLTGDLSDLGEVAESIACCFDAAGDLVDEASPELRSLRRQVRLFHQEIKDRLESILRSPSYVPILQENYYTIRANRYVLPVKAEARHRVEGIVHDSSLSGATVFIEPQVLVDLNNQLKMAELELEHEIYRILRDLSTLVADHAGEISADQEILGRVDLLYAKARLSRVLDACAPRLNRRGPVRLLGARHPLLALAGAEVVPNDICLGEEVRVLIITGPNAGGKTIALKTVGLCALMVRAGLHVPAAPGSEVPFFPEVFADIGDQQSIESSLSTFSAHLLNISDILRQAGPGTLVLLDEVATATDPQEGAALAQAMLEAFAGLGARVLATTHYGQLKGLAFGDPRFSNAGMEFNRHDLRPTYRLQLGLPGRSYGMEIAGRLGLPPEVCRRARELLGAEQVGLDRLLEELEKRRLAAAGEEKRLARLAAEAESLRAQYREKLDGFRVEKKEALARSQREIRSLMAGAGEEIEGILKAARAEGRGDGVREEKKSLERLERRVAGAAREVFGDLAPAPEPSEERGPLPCRPGETVEVIPLGKKGTLLDEPAAGTRVRVQVGRLALMVETRDLRPWRGPASAPGASGRRRSLSRAAAVEVAPGAEPGEESGGAQAHLPHSGNTCDLRGLRVEEALEEAEKFLDQAVLGNVSHVYLVHGHGTGALKSALRGYLETSPYVRSFRPGERHEGGDGVTLAELEK